MIYDEIGRGTSTYDGLSIAQAVLEYSADKKKMGSKVMFATHYHEITSLSQVIEGVNNYCIAVKKRGDDITFLRKIIKGAADDSYGIEVAKLAGVPEDVIKRAKVVLSEIESGERGIIIHEKVREIVDEEMQVSMEGLKAMEVVEDLKSIDLDVLTPLESMNLLFNLQKKATT